MEFKIVPNIHLDKNDPLRGKKSGKWTKWGGYVNGMVKEAIQDCWYCQSCGLEIPAELKPFLYEMYPGDFVRVCNKCFYELWVDENVAEKNDKEDEDFKVLTLRRVIKISRESGPKY